MEIRLATKNDEDAVWQIFHTVVAAGDSFVFAPDISRAEAMDYWFSPKTHTYVALWDGHVVGSYYLKANQPGLGSHVANAGFMVAPAARGHGVGRKMAEHCLEQARQLGFRAMQFNFVVSTNESAVRLWRQLGFAIVGTLPGAFRHPQKGYVDVHVMFRTLEPLN